MSTSTNIKSQLSQLQNTIWQAQAEMSKLQDICQHENVSKKHKSNTGNWDPHSDCYWTEFRCPDCSKFWMEDQ